MNNKIYIGSHKTKNPMDDYMGSGKYLKRAILKYGLENFKKEILFDFENEIEMYDKERELVNEDFIKDDLNYNIILGGNGGFSYINNNGKNIYENHKELASKHIKIAHKKWMEIWRDANENYKSQFKNKMRDIGKEWNSKNEHPFKGRKHTEDSKRKMSEYKKDKVTGKDNPMFGKCWINDGKVSIICDRDNIPDGWLKGRVKNENTKKILNKIKSIENKIKINKTQQEYYNTVYKDFISSEFSSIREYCKSGRYDKSHVNLTKMFKRYIPDLYKSEQGKVYKNNFC